MHNQLLFKCSYRLFNDNQLMKNSVNNRMWLLTILFTFLCFPCTICDAQEAGKQIKMSSGFEYDYLLYLPKEYGQTDKKWPLLMFLHGYVETGVDDADVLRNATGLLPGIVEDEALSTSLFGEEGFPFILISPFCRPGEWWWNPYLDEVLDEVLNNLYIDRSRIYITGQSMGGFGTWSYASVHSDIFAAMVPICGAGESSLMSSDLKGTPPAAIEKLVDIPVWAFHSKDDPTVPLSYDENTVNALRELGGNVKFTVLESGGHFIWGDIHRKLNGDIYAWMLSHTKAKITAPLYQTGNVLSVGIYNVSNTSSDLVGSAELLDNNGAVYVDGNIGTWIPDTEFRWKAVFFENGNGQEEYGWRLRNFDDSQWNNDANLGFPIGYGTETEEGKIDILLDPTVETIYTRSIFDVKDYDSITELTIKIAGDDAAIAWLNGVYIGVTGEGVSSNNMIPQNWTFDTTTRNHYYCAWDSGDPFNFTGPGTTQIKVKVDLVEKKSTIGDWELYN